MTTISNAISQGQLPPADGLKASSVIDATIDVEAKWLHQARMVRDEALHLLKDRIKEDLESAAQILDGRNPSALAAESEFAEKLIADYVAESEKLFLLMSGLMHGGATVSSPAGHSGPPRPSRAP